MRIVWWLAAVTVIGLLSIMLSERRALNPIQDLSLTASAPVLGGLRDIASPLDDIYQGITDRGRLARENRRLQEELEQVRQLLAEQQDAEQRIRELEDALAVKQNRPEDQLLTARVIAQDPSGLRRIVAIDRGIEDGLDEGMVVLSRGGSLVGTVSRVYRHFAWVRLITDPDSAVNAQVNLAGRAGPGAGGGRSPQPSPAPDVSGSPQPDGSGEPLVRGVAQGHLREELLLEMVPADAPLTEGDLAVTSGLGGNYPPSLLLGAVSSVQERPQAPFKRARIRPAASLSSLDTVLVLTSFTPARLTLP